MSLFSLDISFKYGIIDNCGHPHAHPIVEVFYFMQIKKFIGDKAFYKMVLALTIPIIIQNGITNFVNLLDNVMVGQLSPEEFAGTGIANQLMFVCNLAIFGGLSGSGIFTAQFFGKNDHEGIRHTMRFKLYTVLILLTVCGAVLIPFGKPLISAFLTDDGQTGDVALALHYGYNYLLIALVSLIPSSLAQVYASTLRETGHTVPPMLASVAAVLANAVFNYILIFGKLGLPALGVNGAALGTVMARVIELAIVMIWSHANAPKIPYIKGVYRSFKIPAELSRRILVKCLPLLSNEFLWSSGMAILNQCYSTRGMAAVNAINMSTTVTNLFNIVFISLGTSLAILVGNQLGAGKIEEAKDTDRKIIAFSMVICTVVAALMVACSPLFTMMYNATDEIKALAASLIAVCACMMPFDSFAHNCYFTLRSGGQTFITFLFDSAFVWTISIPTAFLLSRFTDLTLIPLFIICTVLNLLKCVIGAVMLKSGKWARKLV